MTNHSRRAFLSGLGAAGVAGLAGCGGDSSQSTETPGLGTDALEDVWHLDYDDPTRPAFGDDTLYFGTFFHVSGSSGDENKPAVGVDEPGGATRWETPLADGMSSPELHDGRLYVTTSEDHLRVLRPADGTILWSYEYAELDNGFAAPTVTDELVATVRDPYEDGGGRLVAVDRETRDRRFTAEPVDALLGATAGGSLVGRTESHIRSYGPDGSQQWAIEHGSSHDSVRLHDGWVYVLGDQHLTALDAATGEERWRTAVGRRLDWELRVTAESVLATGEDGLLRSFTHDGEPRWRHEFDSDVLGGPVRLGEFLVADTADGIMAVDAGRGTRRWSFTRDSTGGMRWIDADGENLYLGTDNGPRRLRLTGDGT